MYVDFPTKLETHFEDKTSCRWQETPARVLYIAVRCAWDSCGDDGAGVEEIIEAEAPGDETQSPSGFLHTVV